MYEVVVLIGNSRKFHARAERTRYCSPYGRSGEFYSILKKYAVFVHVHVFNCTFFRMQTHLEIRANFTWCLLIQYNGEYATSIQFRFKNTIEM